MFPLILISKSEEKINQFTDEYIKINGILPYSIFKISPQNTEITIAQIREIKKTITFTSSSKRLFIIYSFDRASHEAQNALLKTLEDNSFDNQFILISQNEEGILPTIRSRAKIILLETVNQKVSENQKLKQIVEDLITKLIKDPHFVFLADKYIIGLSKEEVIDFLDQTILYFRNQLRKKDRKAEIVIKKIFEYKKLLLRNNLNTQIAIDNLLIFIKKTYT